MKSPVIRERLLSHLLNIYDTLAANVARGLGLKSMPVAAEAAVPTRQDLEPSPALSILQNGPERFEGRKLGILLTDGFDANLLKALQKGLLAEKATFEIITPVVGGAEASDGTMVEGDQMIDGGPSVLYDAVVLLTSDSGMLELMNESTARDFVADAFAHCKFIGYSASARVSKRRARARARCPWLFPPCFRPPGYAVTVEKSASYCLPAIKSMSPEVSSGGGKLRSLLSWSQRAQNF